MSLVKVGSVYYAKIRHPRTNKIIRKTTGTGNKTLARRVEKGITAELIKGLWSPEADRLTFIEMAEDIRKDYSVNDRKGGRTLDTCINSLSKFFGDKKAIEVTVEGIRDYKLMRKETVANDTVNSELIILRRMFNIAKTKTDIIMPKIELLPSKIRRVFFTKEEFEALRGCLPDYLKVLVTLAYHSGMRKSEMLSLQWDQISFNEDKKTGKISLLGEKTKNGEPRVIFLKGEWYQAMLKQRDWTLREYPACQWVFNYKGNKISYIKRQWKKALELSGLKDKKLHDFRRTALSDMTRRGIPQVTAMKISGHKTASVFQRYNITSEEDLERAAEIMASYDTAVTQKTPSAGLELGHTYENEGIQVENLEDFEASKLLENKENIVEEYWCPRHDLNVRPTV